MTCNSLYGVGAQAIDANLVFRLKCNDNAASTTVLDSSGNGNHGTLLGGRNTADLHVSSISGKNSGSLDLNGSGDIISLPVNMTAWPYTLGIKVQADAAVDDFIFSQGDTTSTSRYFALRAANGVYSINSRNTFNRLADGTTAIGGVDSVVGVWAADDDQRLYVNGVNEATIFGTTSANALANAMRIGGLQRTTESNYFNGRVEEAFAFSRALTIDEQNELASGEEPTRLADPVVSQTATYLETTEGSWDNRGNGVITYSYQWEVADDASGANAEGRAVTARMYPKRGDVGNYARVTVRASNLGGFDDFETYVSAWQLITADVPAEEGQTKVVHGVIPTSGTVDLTSSGFGTPSAALITVSQTDGGLQESPDAYIGFGFWVNDGSDTQGSIGSQFVNGSSSGTDSRRGATLDAVRIPNAVAMTCSATTDGITLTYASGAPATDQLYVTAILFDSNVQAEGWASERDGANGWPDHDLEFAPTGMIAFCNGDAFPDNSESSALMCIGAMDQYERQCYSQIYSRNNSHPTQLTYAINNDGFSAQAANGSVDWVIGGSWVNGGYTLAINEVDSNAGSDGVLFIALGNIGMSVELHAGPTANGSSTFAAKGVSQPSCTMFLNSVAQPGTNLSSGGEAQYWGIGIDDGIAPRAYGVCSVDNTTPTFVTSTYDTASQVSWVPISASAIIQSKSASVGSFGNGAYTLDYATGTGTARAFGAITFGSLTPADPSSNWMFGKGKWADSGVHPQLHTFLELQDTGSSTQLTDSSGNGHHGAIVDGTAADMITTGTKWSPNAMVTDGTAYGTFASETRDAFTSEFTLMWFWQWPPAPWSGSTVRWFGQNAAGSDNVFADNGGERRRVRFNTSNLSIGPTPDDPANDEWTGHIVSAIPDEQCRYTLDDNGTIRAGRSSTFASGIFSGFNPGNIWKVNGVFYDSPIREIGVFTGQLTADEQLQTILGPEPTSNGAPLTTGPYEDGETVTVSDENFDGRNNGAMTFAYQWYEADDALGTNAVAISGEVASSISITAGLVGRFLAVEIAATNNGGNEPIEDTFSAFTEVTDGGGGPGPSPISDPFRNERFHCRAFAAGGMR